MSAPSGPGTPGTDQPRDAPGRTTDAGPEEVQPLAVDTATVVYGGLAVFALALVVTLVVPSLHQGDRDWWPWACVSGLVLGLIGLVYVLRGRGNAAGARRHD